VNITNHHATQSALEDHQRRLRRNYDASDSANYKRRAGVPAELLERAQKLPKSERKTLAVADLEARAAANAAALDAFEGYAERLEKAEGEWMCRKAAYALAEEAWRAGSPDPKAAIKLRDARDVAQAALAYAENALTSAQAPAQLPSNELEFALLRKAEASTRELARIVIRDLNATIRVPGQVADAAAWHACSTSEDEARLWIVFEGDILGEAGTDKATRAALAEVFDARWKVFAQAKNGRG
jgi:hypothetical protein